MTIEGKGHYTVPDVDWSEPHIQTEFEGEVHNLKLQKKKEMLEGLEQVMDEEDIMVKGAHYHRNKAVDEGKIKAPETFKNHTKWPEKCNVTNYELSSDPVKVLEEDDRLADKRVPLGPDDWAKEVADMHEICELWNEQLAQEAEAERDVELEEKAALKVGEILAEREKRFLRGLLVFYLDVGQLPPEKAEAFMDRMRDRYKPITDRFPTDWEIMWFPIRNQPTRIDKIEF